MMGFKTIYILCKSGDLFIKHKHNNYKQNYQNYTLFYSLFCATWLSLYSLLLKIDLNSIVLELKY